MFLLFLDNACKDRKIPNFTFLFNDFTIQQQLSCYSCHTSMFKILILSTIKVYRMKGVQSTNPFFESKGFNECLLIQTLTCLFSLLWSSVHTFSIYFSQKNFQRKQKLAQILLSLAIIFKGTNCAVQIQKFVFLRIQQECF